MRNSLDRLKQRLQILGAPEYALQLWFSQALRDAFAWSHAGGYQPLAQLLEAELPRTLALLGVKSSTEERMHVMSALSNLELAPGALDVFQQLQEANWRIIALTNGSIDSTRQLLSQSNAIQYFAEVYSCDEIKKTKPHREVYQMLQQSATGEVWMVAAHAWDIAGAIRAGLKTAFVTSEEKTYLSIYPKPEVIAPSLIEAIGQIIA